MQNTTTNHYLGTQKRTYQKHPAKPEWKGRQAGAVIFVQDAKNGEILQSLALPFCGELSRVTN